MVVYEYKSFDRKQWIKIFYHNIEAGFFDDNISNFLHSEERNKFSILDQVSDLFKIKGMFEFTLDYGSRGYISWQQNSNPTKVNKKETNSAQIGLKITSNKNNFDRFNGLMMSATNKSHMDGYSGSLYEYFYSVGTRSYYQNEKKKIPGRGDDDEFSLWLRIPSKICTCKNQYRHNDILVCFSIFITRSC